MTVMLAATTLTAGIVGLKSKTTALHWLRWVLVGNLVASAAWRLSAFSGWWAEPSMYPLDDPLGALILTTAVIGYLVWLPLPIIALVLLRGDICRKAAAALAPDIAPPVWLPAGYPAHQPYQANLAGPPTQPIPVVPKQR